MNKTLLFVLLAIGILLGVTLCPLMDNDAAHHAVIGLRMMETGDWTTMTDVIERYTPYFDKPHLQFWLVGLSFKYFGVGAFVYKLSSLIFIALSIFSTYRLAQFLLPRPQSGVVAILVLVSMMAFMLGASVDIRMDAILSGAVIFAIWQGVVCIASSAKRHAKLRIRLYLGLAFGLTLAFMCKGLYGVVVTGVALLFYMIGTKQLRWLFSWRFLLVIAFFAVMILPELWAFYQQFGWKGVRFMLYDQVLIRTGGGMGVSGQSDPTFFLHTLLWTVLPWSALLYFFVFRSLFTARFDATYWLTVPSAVVVIVLLSFSSFKLPHYLNPLLPLLAIFLTSQFIDIQPRSRLLRGVNITQKIVVMVIVILAAVVNYWLFPFEVMWMAVLFALMLLYVVYQLFTHWTSYENMLYVSVAASAVLWIGLNVNFYPQLMKYQAGNVAAAELEQKNIKADQVFLYHPLDYSASFDIHHRAIHRVLKRPDILQKQVAGDQFFVFVERGPFNELASDTTLHFTRQASWVDYRVTRLTPKFLNPATRSQVVDSIFLLKFN
ncbi:MAG: glycosyltransferase family 39 protein [Mucinivorans sp.]